MLYVFHVNRAEQVIIYLGPAGISHPRSFLDTTAQSLFTLHFLSSHPVIMRLKCTTQTERIEFRSDLGAAPMDKDLLLLVRNMGR